MKKTFTLKVLMTLLLLCGVSNVWGETVTGTFTKITSLTDLTTGQYVIVGAQKAKEFGELTYGTIASKGRIPYSDKYTSVPESIANPDGASVWTVTISETSVTLYNAENSKYLATGTSAGYLAYSDNSAISFTVACSNGVFSLGSGSDYLCVNNSSDYWRIYAASTGYNEGVCLYFYKLSGTTPTRTLTSIAVSGTPTKTTYEAGETFDPAGLVVTGTYDDSSTETITSGITWNVTPAGALTAGATSVSVTATVGSITSAAYSVNGLTVNAAPLTFSGADGSDVKFTTGSSSEAGAIWAGSPCANGIITLSGSVTSGTYYSYYDGSVVRFYTNNNLVLTPSTGYKITKVEIVRQSTTGSNSGTINCTGLTASTSNNTTNTNVYTGSAKSAVTFTASAQARFTSIKVYYEEASESVATPTFSVEGGLYTTSQNVEISCATEGATIYYTTDGTAPTSASTEYDGAITVSSTTTIKAIAVLGDDESDVATATYTISVPLTTMDAIFTAATAAGSTATDVFVTFNNWVVSGVKNSNAYVTDGTKGFIVYQSNHGFAVGNQLSGTVQCKVQLYNGSAELTNLSSETEGLTVAPGGSTTPAVKTIDQLLGANTGSVVTVENVTYDGTEFSDGTNTIQPYNSLYSYSGLVNGGVYNITGVYLQYNDTKEILPRSDDDIYLIPAEEYKISISNAIEHGKVEASATEAAAGVEVTLTVTPDAHYSLESLVVTDASENPVTVTDNKFTMPASDVTVSATFTENDKFTVTYTSLGTSVGSEQVYDGETIADAPTPTLEGWTFAGWTTNDEYTTSTTAPELFDSPITENTDLYAVFSKSEGGDVSYNKVTSALSDWRGDYLIAYSDTVFMDGSLDGGTGGVGKAQTHVAPGDAISSDGTTITQEWGDKHYVTLEAINDKDLSEGYVIKSHSTTTPYFYQTGNNNGMESTENKPTAAKYPITVTFNSENDIDIALGGSAKGAILHYNDNEGATGEMFRFYKNGGQKAIYLYKKVNTATTTYTITGPQTQEVTIAASGYSSFSSMMDLELPEGLNAYYVSACDGSNITLAQIEDVIPANTGVVLNGNGGKTYTLTQTTGATAIDGNLLVAVSEETKVCSTSDEGAKTNYILYNGQFHPLAKDATATVGAGKCYLQVATSDINAAGPLTFTFDDATAINAISNATQNGIRYNLSGQAVGKDFKGIVIMNGKKFLQK